MTLLNKNLVDHKKFSGLVCPVQVIAVTGGKGGVGKPASPSI